MKPKLLAICFTMAFGVVFLNAQSQTSTSTHMGKNEMALTGCLQSGTEPNTYVLNNVTPSSTADASTEAAKTPSEMPKAETSYMLTPQKNLNLKEHVGHKVEITGMVEKGKEHKTGQSAAESTMTHFRVDSIKHVSETCP